MKKKSVKMKNEEENESGFKKEDIGVFLMVFIFAAPLWFGSYFIKRIDNKFDILNTNIDAIRQHGFENSMRQQVFEKNFDSIIEEFELFQQCLPDSYESQEYIQELPDVQM